MHKPYLLALDLGTASLGYVAFALDEAGTEPRGILDLGVRVFPDGREPKTGEPLAVQRRLARGIRRNRDRGQNRVRRLVRELIETGLMPEDEQKRRAVFTTICPYSARHQAATDEDGYRLMWMMVMFDLPVTDKAARKEYTRFRNFLLDNGFSMTQFSVYFRLVSSKNRVQRFERLIANELPKQGRVQILTITDKQYENIKSYNGYDATIQRKPSQLQFFPGCVHPGKDCSWPNISLIYQTLIQERV